MSGSEPLAAEARSDRAEPLDALREALSGVMRQVVAAGGGPHHLIGMRWASPEPGALHPARRAVDLAYREVCGGFRPRPTLAFAASGLTVTAKARIAPSPTGPVWDGLSARELAREYSPRVQVPDMGMVFAGWSRDGAEARRGAQALDVHYGPTPAETLDLVRPPRATRAPLWVFIHGGYWQASTKEQHAQFAAGMLEAGFAVATIEYGLLPETPLDRIVAQIRAALTFLVTEADGLGLDGNEIHLAGHSAGGHLAAMAAADRDGPPVRSALLLSGLFDLEPLMRLPVGRLLGVAGEGWRALSPIHLPRPAGVRIGVAVGERESDAFKAQSAAIARAWDAGEVLVTPGENHFEILEDLRGESALLRLARRVAGAS